MNRRYECFVNFAKKMHFDPLLPNDWYSVDVNTLMQNKVILQLIKEEKIHFNIINVLMLLIEGNTRSIVPLQFQFLEGFITFVS